MIIIHEHIALLNCVQKGNVFVNYYPSSPSENW
jgi:hypothetical protein